MIFNKLIPSKLDLINNFIAYQSNYAKEFTKYLKENYQLIYL